MGAWRTQEELGFEPHIGTHFKAACPTWDERCTKEKACCAGCRLLPCVLINRAKVNKNAKKVCVEAEPDAADDDDRSDPE